jgi:CHAT domain
MYDAVLWEKGMVASSVTAQRAALLANADPEALALLDELTSKKNQLAALFRAHPADREAWRKTVDQLQRDTDDLEEEVTRRSAVFTGQKQSVHTHWQQVRDAIQPDEAAVEFVRFPFWDRTAWAKKHYYVALVVRPRAATTIKAVDAPILIPLGEAAKLESGPWDDYRQRVAKGPAASPATGSAFYRAFWKPLEPVLVGVTRVYASPDGVLNEVSWAAIPADDGRMLIEKYDVQVLLSTKDLLIQKRMALNQRAVLIGNPAFDLTEREQAAAVGALRGNAQSDTLAAVLTRSTPSMRQPTPVPLYTPRNVVR